MVGAVPAGVASSKDVVIPVAFATPVSFIVMTAVPLAVPDAAVIVYWPAAPVEKPPVWLTDPTAGETDHPAHWLTSLVVPSLNVPAAVKCCFVVVMRET